MESTPDNLPDRLMWFHETTKSNPLMAPFAPIVEAAEEIKRLRRALVAVQEAAEHGDTDACHELAFQDLKKINK